MNNISINGNVDYINYKFNPYTIPVLVAVVPLFYILPTVFVVIEIIKVYLENIFKRNDTSINPHVFFVIVIQLIMSFLYMTNDYLTIRVTATGIITSWCASIQPNHFIKIVFLLSGYFNYTAMLFPFLLSVLRSMSAYYPMNVEEYCSRIVRFSIPFVFLYPLIFCFPLFPALGDCRQLLGSYPFGAIYFHWRGSWFDVRLAESLIVNSIFWLSACLISNALIYKKLRKLQNNNKSPRLKKAERSLTFITISMFPAYITNLTLLVVYIISPTSSAYWLALRPYGSDCDFVFVPWVFYLTHPIFKKKPVIAVEVHNASVTKPTNSVHPAEIVPARADA